MENGLVVMPVTFPDGETTTLRYPPEMKIAQLGFRGDLGVEYPATGGKVVSITYATVAQVYGDAQPVKVYRGANGATVDYFHAAQAVDPPNATKYDELAFQFGPWLVQVYDVQQPGDFEIRMTDAQRATWARSLTGTLDSNGYLVLHAQEPIAITHNEGQESGFGSEPGNVVELDPHLYCNEPGSDTSARRRGNSGGTHGVSWCVDKEMHISAHGTARFAELAADQLEIAPLGTLLTGTPTTTTTTTTPDTAKTPAVSASFVSPAHGWVLQRGGAVAESTDGGLSWRTIGNVGPLAYDESTTRIRFADAKRGFVHDDHDLFSTDDGGAHWLKLATPFGAVTTLEISHAEVYLVAYDQNAQDFALWSSPTDHLAWSKDPRTLPIGAGPVPFQQLVFAGSNGWVVNEDRTVIGGARMRLGGTTFSIAGVAVAWTNWKPPCLDVNGPARLAASSSLDLVASCDDHEWGGGPIAPAVYFSHDGGATFHRHAAPGFGEIASPNATTAVVFENGVLRRTTDEGASWTEVAHEGRGLNASGTPDLGFTTATQGFVIFGSGQMLMTYDAGATWSAVTLP
jgi:photosystem II stability/assembly factor-like uncharacterized protein